jgi:hypothetical protein
MPLPPRKTLTTLLCLVFTVAGCAATPASTKPTDDRPAASDALLTRLLTPTDPGCAAAVGVEGAVA